MSEIAELAAKIDRQGDELKRLGEMIRNMVEQADNAPAAAGRLMTTREAEKYLSVSPKTLWLMTDRGEIPCARAGSQKRYDRRDLDAWLEGQTKC